MTSSTKRVSSESQQSRPKVQSDLNRLGSTRQYHWMVDDSLVDMAEPMLPVRSVTIDAEPQKVRLDLERTAMLVIDMQNDFCEKGGWVDHVGGDYTANRFAIEPLRKLLPILRRASVPIIWVNWGNRRDLLNMPPNQLHLYKPNGVGVGLGDQLPGNGAPVLQKDSWAAAVVEELEQKPDDIKVDKYRMSGFWDTPLDSILRNLGTKTLLFSGVNTDRCVLCSLQDANFLGYGCVLVEDCCATTSPEYCTQATIFNVKKVFGFVTSSSEVACGVSVVI